jgi:predicted ATPase
MIYRRIAEALRTVTSSSREGGETAVRVLNLYKNLLQTRITEEQTTYKKIRDFEESVNIFLDGKKLVVDGRGGKYRTWPVISATNGKYGLNSLSSGERQVLTMLFSASRLGQGGGIFLVDEPELSLHVDWQRRILGELKKQAKQSQIIACTHAPEVGADHYDALLEFEPRPFEEQIDLVFDDEINSEE